MGRIIARINTVSAQTGWKRCMGKGYCEYPVFVGIGVGALAAILILFCCVRCLCFRKRKNTKYSDKLLDPAPYKGYEAAPHPPVYEPPQSVNLNASQKLATKDDALPLMPTADAMNQKQFSDSRLEDLELGKLKPVHSPTSPTLAHPKPSPVAGLSPIKSLSDSQNPFDEPLRPLNPLDSKPHPPIPVDAQQVARNPFARNPFETGLDENQEHKPRSPLSPKPSYSPYPSSINTRFTPSPFTEPSESRQPSPFSPSTHTRTFSYVPPQPPYAAYSPSASSHHDRSGNEPKSPYRAYSPALSARSPYLDHSSIRESPNPFVVHSPNVSVSHETSSINHEPIELSTPYTTRPQSMVMDEEAHRREAFQQQQSLLQLQGTTQHMTVQQQQQQHQMPGAW